MRLWHLELSKEWPEVGCRIGYPRLLSHESNMARRHAANIDCSALDFCLWTMDCGGGDGGLLPSQCSDMACGTGTFVAVHGFSA